MPELGMSGSAGGPGSATAQVYPPGSRRLRAPPQGSSPWTSLALRLRHPTHCGLRWRGFTIGYASARSSYDRS
jgi:hypothetical protein